MTRTLVLTNHKEGVGKSTSAANIAFGLVQVLRSAGAPNPRVLLVDTDSQGHASLLTTGSKNVAEKVACPVLIQVCEFPSLVSTVSVHRIGALIGDKAQLTVYPASHFDIYLGEYFQNAVAEQVDFLVRTLLKCA